MPRINERISDCVSIQFTGGHGWRTDTVPMDNGDDQRNRKWLYPKGQWSAEFLNFNVEDRNEIIRFHHAAAGSWLDFRFKDWIDYTADDETLLPVIGTQTPVQLVKTYTAGAHSSQRLIQAIVSAIIRRNGTPVTGTLDMELGLFTPSANWVAGAFTWEGEFDCWVHFVEDYNPWSASDLEHWTSPFTLEESKQRA